MAAHRKKIVIDATPVLFPTRGVGRVTRTLLETLHQQQDIPYDLLLYSRCLRNKPTFPTFSPKQTRHYWLPEFTEKLMPHLAMIERSTKGDLFHATDHYLPLKYPEQAVVTLHDLIFLTQPGLKTHPYQAKVVPKFARRAKRVITPSEFSKSEIVEHLQISADKIDVIPWGVDQKVFTPTRDRLFPKCLGNESYDYFLAVGCSTGRKNTPRLLESYARMVRQGPQNHLVLAWDPPPEIFQQYQDGDLKNLVHFIGHVSETDLRDLYRAATVTVFPSTFEGFGLPVLESMSCGTPVVTSHVSSLPEVGGDVAYYVNPLDTGSITRGLEAFENNDPSVHGLREKSLTQAEKFSWEICANRTLETYAKCF